MRIKPKARSYGYFKPKVLLVLVTAMALSFSSIGIMNIHPTHASTTMINIQNFAFNPQNITIQIGTSITWTNNDPVVYTLWFTNPSDGSTYLMSPPINPGSSWTTAFSNAVVLKYYDFDRLYITGRLATVPILRADFGPTFQIGTPTVPFVAAVSGGTGPYKFLWAFGDGAISTASAPTHAFQQFGSYTVSLTVTDSSTPNGFTVAATHLLTLSQTGGGGNRPLEL